MTASVLKSAGDVRSQTRYHLVYRIGEEPDSGVCEEVRGVEAEGTDAAGDGGAAKSTKSV